jgi:AraC-like DNA-binding protein/quercetin dioxygenase-like cupin family protein
MPRQRQSPSARQNADAEARSVRKLFTTLDQYGIAAQYFTIYHADRDPWHTHDMVEMCFVLSGDAEHLIDDRVLPLPKGTFAIVHYGQRHRYRTPRGPIEKVNVYLDAEIALPPAVSPALSGFVPSIVPLGRGLAHERNRLVHLDFDEIEPLRSILLGLCTESGRQRRACPVALRAWYALMLTECARRAQALGSRSTTRARWPEGLLEQVRCDLDAHPEQPHELAKLAFRARMTPSSFCRAFKRHTGRTLVEYLHQRRVERAMMLLGRGDHNVAEAALASGFQDISHFNRVFRRMCGRSPRAWMKGQPLSASARPSGRVVRRDPGLRVERRRNLRRPARRTRSVGRDRGPPGARVR